MKADNKYLILGIGMSLIAAILIAVTVLWYRLGDDVMFILAITLGLPVLLPYIALLVILAKSLGKKDRFHKTATVLSILIALIMPAGCVVTEEQNAQYRYYHPLPDGTEMTVWGDYIIFEHYDRYFAPKDNYLFVGCGQDHYSFCITPDNELFLWVRNHSDKVSAKNPRYKLGGIYEGNAGEYWFNAECPTSEQQVTFSHEFMYDGIFTGGSYDCIVMIQDSAWHRRWTYPTKNYRESWESINKRISRQEQAQQDATELEQYLRFGNIQLPGEPTRHFDYRDSVQCRLREK